MDLKGKTVPQEQRDRCPVQGGVYLRWVVPLSISFSRAGTIVGSSRLPARTCWDLVVTPDHQKPSETLSVARNGLPVAFYISNKS